MKRMLAVMVVGAVLLGMLSCTPSRVSTAHVITPRPTAVVTPSAAPTDSPAPTDTPAPTATDTPDPAACDAYYADAVFVGDSLTVGFARYVRRLRRKEDACLDGADFVAGEGVSIRGLKNDRTPTGTVALQYDEEPVSVTRGIRASGKQHVIILLGTNDLGGVHLEQTLKNYEALLDKILEKCPGVIKISLLAVPPVSEAFCENKGISIDAWNAVNPALERLCSEHGLGYLSFFDRVSDENGYLDEKYSSDGMIHLNADGFAAWLDALRAHAAEQLSDG